MHVRFDTSRQNSASSAPRALALAAMLCTRLNVEGHLGGSIGCRVISHPSRRTASTLLGNAHRRHGYQNRSCSLHCGVCLGRASRRCSFSAACRFPHPTGHGRATESPVHAAPGLQGRLDPDWLPRRVQKQDGPPTWHPGQVIPSSVADGLYKYSVRSCSAPHISRF